MADWLDALLAQSGRAILVTVARAEGSAPREAGAKMLVCRDKQFDTIGGGHLELSAIGFAQEMLAGDTRRRLERFALGPTLGQCCGGVVWLAFERIEAADHPYYRTIHSCMERGQDCWRISSSDAGTANALLDAQGQVLAGATHAVPGTACHVIHHRDGGWTLVDPVHTQLPHLFLFGAGHVGAALVRAMAPLPCRITWVDEREELFPASLPANVEVEPTDLPQAVIAAAPPGASYLVMTHSHALDQQLAQCILRRPDIGWFGLIGSRTKRIQFERRLAARGIPADRIAKMACPIGLSGIRGKSAAVIAASVAAQLLQVWEQQQSAVAPQEVTAAQTTHRERA